MGYYLGIDGGGTKSKITCADETGKVIFSGSAGAMNGNGITGQQLENNINNIIEVINKNVGVSPSNCIKAAVGAAGISNLKVKNALFEAFSKGGFKNIDFYGDHETAFATAFPKGEGIILISGTGSLCYGERGDGLKVRAGGYGHIFDDKGSAYSIAVKILEAVAKANDGRLGKTVFTDLVFKRLGINEISELVGYVYDGNRTKGEIALLATLLSEGIKEGDEAALRILDETASDLSELVLAVEKKLGGDLDVALWGSTIQKNEYIKEALSKRIQNHVFVVEEDASCGALRLAMK